MSRWVDRAEALRQLGVKPQTLYAYVSRGRVGARPDPADPRRSQYDLDDLALLSAGNRRSRAPRAVAAAAMSWGEPVLPTALSTVSRGRFYYRGRDAVQLAERATLEEAAALLWGRPLPPPAPEPAPDAPGLGAALAWLAERAATDRPSFGRAARSLSAEAPGLLRGVASRLGADPAAPTIADGFAEAWNPAAADLIRRALVLLADHELNASTFAARVVASAGASLAAAVLAGLAALTGPLHGRASVGAGELFDEAARVGPDEAVAAQLRRGAPLFGFGQPLYPDIDPRAEALLARLDLDPVARALALAGEAATGHRPNVDFALAAAARAFSWPADAPLLLFAAARTAGWLAHATEQVVSGRLIRPRAHYEGPPLAPCL